MQNVCTLQWRIQKDAQQVRTLNFDELQSLLFHFVSECFQISLELPLRFSGPWTLAIWDFGASRAGT